MSLETFPTRYNHAPQPRLLHQELEQQPRKRNAAEGRGPCRWVVKGDGIPESGGVENKITSKQDASQTMFSWASDRAVCPDSSLQKFWAQTGTSVYTEALLLPTQALTDPTD